MCVFFTCIDRVIVGVHLVVVDVDVIYCLVFVLVFPCVVMNVRLAFFFFAVVICFCLFFFFCVYHLTVVENSIVSALFLYSSTPVMFQFNSYILGKYIFSGCCSGLSMTVRKTRSKCTR